MHGEEGTHRIPAASATPQAPLGHLAHLGFALNGAADADEITRHLLTHLVAVPGIHRVGVALTEGGGRRLLFTASDRFSGDDLGWCHIDAYDDVPLTHVVRTGEPVLGPRAAVHRGFAGFVDKQPAEYAAFAAVPFPGVGSPIGGLLMFLDEAWDLSDTQRRWLEALARRTAEALRRVRASPDTPARLPDEVREGVVTATTELADDPRSPGQARGFLRHLLADAGVEEEVIEVAQLCLSELVTNAVIHAGSRAELTATLDGVLTVTVRDRGSSAAEAHVVRDPDLLRVHGRGLQLVEALADRWGVDRDGLGTTVWFALALAGDTPRHAGSDRSQAL